MRNLLHWLLLLLLCTLCACSRQDPVPVGPVLQDGIWTGTGEGRSGTILVKLTIKDQRIIDIVVVNQSESSFAQETIHEMVARALQKQALLSSKVDAISGATLTSNGMIDAINMALRAAMGQEDKGKTIYKDGGCDVVVIGAGGAGLTAAVQAASGGQLRIIVLEKQAIIGGNTLSSTGGINAAGTDAQKALEEFRRSKAVYDMGIPSAQPYEFVTDGERYGMIVQRIQGKESFGRILADHPERLEELAGITAEYAKALHAIPCITEVFGDTAQSTREMIAGNKTIPEDIKTKILGYIDELEPASTCLHGDINPCNIITAQGKVYWIDLGDFGYGDPLLDFFIMEHMSHLGPTPLIRHIFHIDRPTLRRYYESFCKQYFGERWGSSELREKMDRIAQIQAAKALCIWPSAYHVNLPFLQGKKLKTALNLFIGDHMKMK